MSEHKGPDGCYSHREYVLAQRRAFVAGWIAYQQPGMDRTADQEAARCYPLPKVTRPRVVREGGGVWRCVAGRLQMQFADDSWRNIDDGSNPLCLAITPQRVRIWADLVASPTEECDQ